MEKHGIQLTKSCSQSFSLKLPGKSSIRCDNLCKRKQEEKILLVQYTK